ncbi:D-threo-aldose 1-dehydrogenase [Sphingomonas glacialis]|uniref:D-threo-aldose 1-dehydrogenase n=1 Tax=Sphingomonas glacialis TaxID=658225 RepID=A0ABQ3LB02_9SPHN|nr:aldo/keto reductase [Sphingomonas glacialis]GHH09863.1 D-threo-aldose 1-dehydrogenase [Sphingomonas glacialis]
MIALPTLGMGCAGIGNLYRPVDDRVAGETVAAALAAGIGYFDVAPHYGFGLGETRLGAALAEHDPQARALISTKVGRLLEPTDSDAAERHGFVDAPPLEPVFDYTYDAVLRSIDASRARLRRERIDLLFAHDLGAMVHGNDAARHMADFLAGGYLALRRLRDAGEVAGIGVGVNEIAVCHVLLDRVELDVILLAGRYTLLEQDAAAALIERCRATGTRLVIGGPYNSGILVEGSRTASHFDYAPPPASVVARVAELERACARFDVPLPAAALQFPLREAAVACVIPGLVGAEQVAATLQYAEWPIPDALWDAVGVPSPHEHAA